MNGTVKIKGLEGAMKAMGAAFPKNPEQQRRILNSSMRHAATGSILPKAKLYARSGEGSGALAESLGIRAQSKFMSRAKRMAAGIQVLPIRSNRRAMAMYMHHYGVRSVKSVVSGIRHGHFVEFGVPARNISARPFLWPAAQAGTSGYRSSFAASLRKKTEAAVRAAARKAARK